MASRPPLFGPRPQLTPDQLRALGMAVPITMAPTTPLPFSPRTQVPQPAPRPFTPPAPASIFNPAPSSITRRQPGPAFTARAEQGYNAAWAPQRPDESGLSVVGRNMMGAAMAPGRALMSGMEGIGGAITGLTQSPNDRADLIFAKAIVSQESGGRQLDARGNPLVGRRPDGSIPSTPAFGAAQIVEGTARATAEKHGIPWDRNRWLRDKDYNLTLGRTHFRDLYNHFGGDEAKAAAAYHSGQGGVEKAVAQAARSGTPWVQHLGPNGQKYVPEVMARIGNLAGQWGAPPPDFSAAAQGFQQFNANVGQAEQAAMTPFSATVNQGPAPASPDGKDFVTPDFSAGDKAFTDSAPKQPFEDETPGKLLRRNLLAGMAEAMMTIPGGRPVGFGEMLLKLGSGAMLGRVRGEEAIQQRQDKYDHLMQQYNQALAQRNDSKAQQTAQILNQNIAADNDENWKKFGLEYDRWQKRGQWSIQGNHIITEDVDPKTGVKTVNGRPIEAFVRPMYAMQKAQAALSFGSANQQYQQWAYSTGQSLATQAMSLVASQQGSPGAQADAVMGGLAQRAVDVVNTGAIWQVLPRELADRIYNEAAARYPSQPSEPGGKPADVTEEVNQAMAEILVSHAARDSDIAQLLFQSAHSQAAAAVASSQRTRTSRRTDSRGRTSVTQTEAP